MGSIGPNLLGQIFGLFGDFLGPVAWAGPTLGHAFGMKMLQFCPKQFACPNLAYTICVPKLGPNFLRAQTWPKQFACPNLAQTCSGPKFLHAQTWPKQLGPHKLRTRAPSWSKQLGPIWPGQLAQTKLGHVAGLNFGAVLPRSRLIFDRCLALNCSTRSEHSSRILELLSLT